MSFVSSRFNYMVTPAVYAFPPNRQSCIEHPRLIENTVIKNGIKSIVKRGQYRNLVMTLTSQMQAIYLDEQKNICFNGKYLDEIKNICFNGEYLDEIKPPSINVTPVTPTVLESQPRSLASLTKDMVLDKFTGKNQNAQSWINTFSVSYTHLTLPTIYSV